MRLWTPRGVPPARLKSPRTHRREPANIYSSGRTTASIWSMQRLASAERHGARASRPTRLSSIAGSEQAADRRGLSLARRREHVAAALALCVVGCPFRASGGRLLRRPLDAHAIARWTSRGCGVTFMLSSCPCGARRRGWRRCGGAHGDGVADGLLRPDATGGYARPGTAARAWRRPNGSVSLTAPSDQVGALSSPARAGR